MNNNPVFLEMAVTEEIITPEDVLPLSEKFKGDALALLSYLLQNNVGSKEVLGKLWGDSIGVSYVDLNKTLIQDNVVKMLPEKFAHRHQVIPLYQMGTAVTLAAANPGDQEMLQNVSALTMHVSYKSKNQTLITA